jgi:prepilin-type N-terminal cleavage/methylation domain-containing protein/prepilin-type processing-associated H-X9-DG protein
MHSARRSAFTLVELLVVIGIIAVLISVLLPALGAARRQSQAVKCLTQLREIGNAFTMYANDSKGYYPPAQLRLATGAEYTLDGSTFTAGDPTGIYWFNFINKYVSKNKAGRGTDDTAQRDQIVKSSVIWGCPNWEGYPDTGTSAGTNPVQVGFGMNGYPTFMPDYPKAVSGPFGGAQAPPTTPENEWSWNSDNFKWSTTTNRTAGFIKQKVYGRMGTLRCLVADSRLWLAASDTIPNTGVIPTQMTEVNANNQISGQTNLAMWRHGKIPGIVPGTPYAMIPLKGTIGYNILYCDGHVATSNEPKEAYKSIRMKFPG